MPLALMIAFFAFATAPCFAAEKETERPDREMLQMLGFLREMEMLQQMEMMQELKRIESVSETTASQPSPIPPKKKESPK
jgi:hypothetical protein